MRLQPVMSFASEIHRNKERDNVQYSTTVKPKTHFVHEIMISPKNYIVAIMII